MTWRVLRASRDAPYDLQSPVEADRTTCRDPAGPGPQTSPRGPGSRTAGLPGTNGVESPGDQARAWSQCREVLFQRRFSLDPLTGGADGLARVFCALSHSTHRRPRPADRPTPHFGDLLDRRDGREQSVAPTTGALGRPVCSVANSQLNAPAVEFAQRNPARCHTSLQAPTPHFMIMVAVHARHFHSRRPVA